MDFSDRPMLPSIPPRGILTELPGPRARSWMARGSFDMQSRYRSFVMADAASRGCSLVDVDGDVFLDLFDTVLRELAA